MRITKELPILLFLHIERGKEHIREEIIYSVRSTIKKIFSIKYVVSPSYSIHLLFLTFCCPHTCFLVLWYITSFKFPNKRRKILYISYVRWRCALSCYWSQTYEESRGKSTFPLLHFFCFYSIFYIYIKMTLLQG